MPSISTFRNAFALVALLVTSTSAQTCYYPDGTVSAVDTPCTNDPTSSCCGSSAFCLKNGLCYTNGLVTRGSCTDKTWGSAACAGYCKSVSPNTDVAIVPCTTMGDNVLYDCGLTSSSCQTAANLFNMTDADKLVLRPKQVAALVSSAVTSADNSTASSTTSNGGFGIGALAGVAAALGIPLLIAVAIVIWLYRKGAERRPRTMYPLPDENKSEFSFRPPGGQSPGYPAYRPTSSQRDDASVRSGGTGNPGTLPTHMQSSHGRYQKSGAAGKSGLRMNVMSTELDSRHIPRHELSDRLSIKSAAGHSFKSAAGQVREITVSR